MHSDSKVCTRRREEVHKMIERKGEKETKLETKLPDGAEDQVREGSGDQA